MSDIQNDMSVKAIETVDFGEGGKGDASGISPGNHNEKNSENIVVIAPNDGVVNTATKGTTVIKNSTVGADSSIDLGLNEVDSAAETRHRNVFDVFENKAEQEETYDIQHNVLLNDDISNEDIKGLSKSRYVVNTNTCPNDKNISSVTLFQPSPLYSGKNEYLSPEILSEVNSETSNGFIAIDDVKINAQKFKNFRENSSVVDYEMTSSGKGTEFFVNLESALSANCIISADFEITDESDSPIDLQPSIDWNCFDSDSDESECERRLGQKQFLNRREGLAIKDTQSLVQNVSQRLEEPDIEISTPTIEDFSPEVLLLIFSYIGTQDLQQNVSKVCKSWSELSRRPCLRRELRLYGSHPTTSETCDLLQSYPNLRILEIEERNDLNEILSKVSVTNKRLCSLIIKRCWNPLQYDVVSDEVIEQLFRGCVRLSSLTIKRCPFSGFFEVFHHIKEHLGQIKRLNLNFVAGLESAEDVRLIAESCPHLEDFRALTRPACNAYLFYVVQDCDVRLLTSRLSATLKVLKLEGDALTDQGVEALTCCQHLRKLCLRRVRNMTDVGLLELARLEELTALELVDVARPSAEGWKQLFRRCCWRRLNTLLLARCINIDDEALLWGAAACRQLKCFCIAGCYLTTSKGLKVMFRACPMIEELIVCLSQTKGCIFWIPTLVPNVKKILYHSCYRLRSDQNAKDEFLLIKKVFKKKYPNLDISYIECLNDLMVVS